MKIFYALVILGHLLMFHYLCTALTLRSFFTTVRALNNIIKT